MTTDGDDVKVFGQETHKGHIVMSPYYLHPSDNPGSLISPVQLRRAFLSFGWHLSENAILEGKVRRSIYGRLPIEIIGIQRTMSMSNLTLWMEAVGV